MSLLSGDYPLSLILIPIETHIVLAPDAGAAVATLAQALASSADPPADAVEVNRGRNIIWRVPCGSGTVCVKAFGPAHWPNPYVYATLRQSKARRSFQNAQLLLARGFRTPAPLAYIEVFRTLGPLRVKLLRSYYICEWCADSYVRQMDRRDDLLPLCHAIGRDMARLAKAGIWMKDYSQGNILAAPDPSTPDGYRLSYLDLNRLRSGLRPSDRRLWRMFRNLARSPQGIAALATAYAQLLGIPPSQAVARANLERHRYLKAKGKL